MHVFHHCASSGGEGDGQGADDFAQERWRMTCALYAALNRSQKIKDRVRDTNGL